MASFDWANTTPAQMGWNQTVRVQYGDFNGVIKVKDFSVGITQKFEVPDLVTGATDRLTWSKGVVEVGGSLNAPLTASFANSVIKAANDAATGTGLVTLTSTVHGTMQAKVNTCRVSCEAEGPIEVSCDLFGRLVTGDVQSSTNGKEEAQVAYGGTTNFNGGADPTGLVLEQIPMFDQVKVNLSMLPGNQSEGTYLLPIGVTFSMDNKLVRNYVLGLDNSSSLNALSISAGQRVLSGTMKFQSGQSGQIAYVTNAGAGKQAEGNFLDFAGLIQIDASKYVPIWSAAPPQLNTGKVIIELEYQLVAVSPGFWITINGAVPAA